ELYNNSTNRVDLTGWYLSNKSTNLTQWSFPSTNIGPRGFLVVFASGKNRRVPGAPLHTSFKLSKAGEYLALVMPDGVTKATEFAPAFPQQYTDISYGYVMAGTPTNLLTPTAGVRAFVPSASLGTGWIQPGFDDSAWATGTSGVGFDLSGNYSPAIGLDLKTAMYQANSSAFLRLPFTVNDVSDLGLLTLSLRYDDGFVAYLNGTEVLRRNAPSTLLWNSAATGPHGAPSPGILTQTFETPSTDYTLSQYGSTPGPAVQSGDGNSTGSYLRLLYDGVNSSANSVTFRETAPGLFQTITADFDFRLTSAPNNPADGFAFMLIPTSLYGTNGPGVNTSVVAVEQPNYRGVFGVGFRVYPHTSINNVSVHWDGSRMADAAIPTPTLDLAAGVFHHAHLDLRFQAGGAVASVILTGDINGTPGVPYAALTNVFIPGLNPFDCRVQFGGRTGGLNMSCDLDNCQVQFLSSPGPVAFEDFDISPFAGSLVPGQNLLAIQGLNVTANDPDFLIQPQIIARAVSVADIATFLYPPTPGAWNGGTGAAVVPPAVAFSPPAGA
ncbi:MAG TPA: lamin tail domain-containing protein, partial [Verrucomicrobiae bacterium]|nr:lamin tail domain-containing protein [Verrucomicrobiae bacterium]